MARKSLRPQLNQIRTWVRQGRTDAWIAHQLEVTTQQIASFKRENELVPGEAEPNGTAAGLDFDDEIDLRAEDDALIAAELEAARVEKEKAEAEAAAAKAKAAKAPRSRTRAAAAAADDVDEDTDEDDGDKPARRRGRRGGRGRRKAHTGPLEGTFDHGEEGYGLWLDPAVQDDPIYAEHWAGHRPVEITIEEDQIVIRRSGGTDEDE
jgi:membrane protein involved in colicin uptake